MKRKKFFIGLFIFAAIGLFVFAHITLKHNRHEYRPPEIQAPIEIPDESILTDAKKAAISNKPVLALFYVDWCTYCRRFMPIFGEFAKKYKDKYTFVAINCDKPENSEIVHEYRIMGFPSLYIIDNKINHKFSLHMAATGEPEVFKEELDNYLKVRENFKLK